MKRFVCLNGLLLLVGLSLQAAPKLRLPELVSAADQSVTLTLQLEEAAMMASGQWDLYYDASLLTMAIDTWVANDPAMDVYVALLQPGQLRVILTARQLPLPRPRPETIQIEGQATVNPNLADGVYLLTAEALLLADQTSNIIADTEVIAGQLTIRSQNLQPIAYETSFSFREDTPGSGQLSGSDLDQDPIRFQLVEQPTLGTLLLTGPDDGTFSFIPFADAEGSDQFTFRVWDGIAYSQTATVSLNVVGSADAPHSVTMSMQTQEDEAVSATPQVVDPDLGDTHNFMIQGAPADGTAEVVGAQVRFTPANDFVGNTTFTIQATDRDGLSVTGTVNVTVLPVNDPPQLQIDNLILAEDGNGQATVNITDPDLAFEGDQHRLSVVEPPQQGSVTLESNQVTYQPTANWNGSDVFTLRVTDEAGESTQQQVQVTVTPVNDPPTAVFGMLQVCFGEESARFEPTIEDVDFSYEGDQHTLTLLSDPAHGLVTLGGDGLQYEHTGNTLENDAFQVRATDAAGQFVEGIIQVEIRTFTAILTARGVPLGLEPVTLEATTDCGLGAITFEWYDVDTGTLLATGAQFEVSPLPTQTKPYRLTARDESGNLLETTVTVLVHPAGVDLNGDGLNDLNDLYLAASTFASDTSLYEANGDTRLDVRDLVYIHTGN